MTEAEVEQILHLLRSCAGEAPRHPPARIIPRLEARLRAGKPVPGRRRLGEIIGQEVVEKATEWLGIKRVRSNSTYDYRDSGTYLLHGIKDGEPKAQRLANFVAEIVEVIERDDGSGVSEKTFIVESGPDQAEVRAEDFDSLAWVTPAWGPAKSVAPGRETKAHMAEAIKRNSTDIEHLKIYTHTGWIRNEEEVIYLHAGGAIGASGAIEGFTVELSGKLQHLVLKAPAVPSEAIRASFSLAELGPVGILMLAAVYRAPLAEFLEITTSVFVEGKTGTFKSAIQGIALSHWGSYWDGVQFTANWTATANSLERVGFTLKDALTVVDDFKPSGPGNEVERLHQTAERMLRAAANHGGRLRMNADSSLRTEYYPRGLVMSSGEDVPKGHSLRARMIIHSLEKGQIDTAVLSRLQEAAAGGLLSEAMAMYVQFIAAEAKNGLKDKLAKRFNTLRSELAGDHARTPGNIASLIIGIEYFSAFALSAGAINNFEGQELLDRARTSIGTAARTQDLEQASEDPTTRFVALLSEALAAGRVHLTNKAGGAPPGREAVCGWRERVVQDVTSWYSAGDQIGWIEADTIWIRPHLAYAAVERLSRDQNRSLGVTQLTLFKRLLAAGLIGQTTTVRAVGANSAVSRVYPIKANLILPPPEEPSQVQRLIGFLSGAVGLQEHFSGDFGLTLARFVEAAGNELERLDPQSKDIPM